jgi:signal transduction histidine kinase
MKREAAGQTLHDDIGPLLSAAGLHLQLIATDFPKTAKRMDEVFRILDEAMERVRSLSRELAPREARQSRGKAAFTADSAPRRTPKRSPKS